MLVEKPESASQSPIAPRFHTYCKFYFHDGRAQNSPCMHSSIATRRVAGPRASNIITLAAAAAAADEMRWVSCEYICMNLLRSAPSRKTGRKRDRLQAAKAKGPVPVADLVGRACWTKRQRRDNELKRDITRGDAVPLSTSTSSS